MITRNRARLIAGEINSGANSPLHLFYRQNIVDRHGIILEIKDIQRYVNPRDRKRLSMIQEYVLMNH